MVVESRSPTIGPCKHRSELYERERTPVQTLLFFQTVCAARTRPNPGDPSDGMMTRQHASLVTLVSGSPDRRSTVRRARAKRRRHVASRCARFCEWRVGRRALRRRLYAARLGAYTKPGGTERSLCSSLGRGPSRASSQRVLPTAAGRLPALFLPGSR